MLCVTGLDSEGCGGAESGLDMGLGLVGVDTLLWYKGLAVTNNY